jgi:hypothetical protein
MRRLLNRQDFGELTLLASIAILLMLAIAEHFRLFHL